MKESWIKEGSIVEGRYMNQPIVGRVVESRVKYGGAVQHTVDLLEPIQLRWRTDPTIRVLVLDSDVKEMK